MGGMRILFARHGRTAWNHDFRYQGSYDVPLDDEGEAQARRLGMRLSSWRPDIILASPLSRARRTAEIVRDVFPDPPPLEARSQLAEMDFGSWEGLSVHEIEATYGETYARWRRDPSTTTPEGGEPFDAVEKRVRAVVDPLLVPCAQKSRVLVVSHGGTIRVALLALLGLPPSFFWRLRIDNCALSAVDIWNGECSLLFLNDFLHLLLPVESVGGVPLGVWSW